MQINGFLVQGGQRGGEGNLGDHFGLARGVHHDEIVAGDGAQADASAG